MQVAIEAHIEPLRASLTLEIPKLASGSNKEGDPLSLPPLVEVQATTRTHIEPLEASPMNEMPEPTNASITIVEHKQSSASAHEAADRPSPPNQVKAPDTTCDAIGHI